jgi:hypothetical protein
METLAFYVKGNHYTKANIILESSMYVAMLLNYDFLYSFVFHSIRLYQEKTSVPGIQVSTLNSKGGGTGYGE